MTPQDATPTDPCMNPQVDDAGRLRHLLSLQGLSRALLDPGAQSAMGQEMARRRGVR